MDKELIEQLRHKAFNLRLAIHNNQSMQDYAIATETVTVYLDEIVEAIEALEKQESEQVSAEETFIRCKHCNGDGYTVEPECCRNGKEQCCGIPIPIQVQCSYCQTIGFVPMQTYLSKQSDAIEYCKRHPKEKIFITKICPVCEAFDYKFDDE